MAPQAKPLTPEQQKLRDTFVKALNLGLYIARCAGLPGQLPDADQAKLDSLVDIDRETIVQLFDAALTSQI